nr:UxaA family hydrolase [uncultured Oscillibacter sp.]
MKANALMITPQDDVVVAIAALKAGDQVAYMQEEKQETLTAATDVPPYHKIAVRDLPCGTVVKKYNQIIGAATKDVRKGEHVHVHNLDSLNKVQGK